MVWGGKRGYCSGERGYFLGRVARVILPKKCLGGAGKVLFLDLRVVTGAIFTLVFLIGLHRNDLCTFLTYVRLNKDILKS